MPEQAPLQLAKVEPPSAVAVRITRVPAEKLTEQVDPQAIPDGDELTVPLPAPAHVTVSAVGVTTGGGVPAPAPS